MEATFLKRLNFLPALFEENKNYSNVVCARSVLSALIKPVNGIEFGKQILVKIFIKDFLILYNAYLDIVLHGTLKAYLMIIETAKRMKK